MCNARVDPLNVLTGRVWSIKAFTDLRLSCNGSTERGSRERTHLIASHFLRNVVQRLYYPQAQLLPLLILRHGNILNMSHQTQIMYTKPPVSMHLPSSIPAWKPYNFLSTITHPVPTTFPFPSQTTSI